MRKNLFVGLLAVLFTVGCQTPATNTTTNTNTNLSNTNVNMTNTNMNMTNTSANTTTGAMETREPSEYQADVTLKFEAVGDQKSTLPAALMAKVARQGENRRMEFTLPGNQNVVYIDTPERNVLILPNRKQFANINRESVGFDVRRMLMPEEIVRQLQNVQGVQRAGEEQLNGRTVIRYNYGSTTNTQTQAGQVATESYFLIDKETGLPLRSESVSQSQAGNVQGFTGARMVTEMSNIQTNVNSDLFNVPTDYQEVEEQQIRNQVNMVFQAAAAFIGQIMKQAQTTNSPAATPSPQR